MSLRSAYAEKVCEIHAERPAYRKGGDGSDGTCDCVGLGIGALRRMGIAYDGLHGSNWAARNEAVELWEIGSIAQLRIGDNVLKCRGRGDPKWDLPERYSAHPDQNDYYHMGVVISVDPLMICHCTTPTTTVDTRLGSWSHAFLWRQLAQTEAIREEDMMAVCKRQVALSSGYLNLRAGPSASDRDIGDIPNGAVVEILVDGEWPFVRYEGKTGYVKGCYLKEIGESDSEAPDNGAPADGQTAASTTLISEEDGRTVTLLGRWRTAED